MDNNGRMDCYFPKTPVEETVQTTENRASFSGVEQSGSTILTVAVRNRLKRGSGVVARYPTEHEKKSIPDRPLRR